MDKVGFITFYAIIISVSFAITYMRDKKIKFSKKIIGKNIRTGEVVIYAIALAINFLLFKESSNKFSTSEINIYVVIKNILLMIVITAIEVFPILKMLRAGKKYAQKESMSKIDFSKEKGWFRDILRKYTVAQLSYIDDFNIEPVNDIAATILNLKLKKKIEIKENGITVINKDGNDLNLSERYILSKIKKGKVRVDSLYSQELTELAKRECESGGLVEPEENKFKKIIKKFFKDIVILLIIIYVFKFILQNGNLLGEYSFLLEDKETLNTLKIIVIGIYAVYFLTYLRFKVDLGKRTKKGEEINIKVEGLKHYIKEYTSLNEKEQSELVLWEEYLVYSVLFGHNKKLINEVSKNIILEVDV